MALTLAGIRQAYLSNSVQAREARPGQPDIDQAGSGGRAAGQSGPNRTAAGNNGAWGAASNAESVLSLLRGGRVPVKGDWTGRFSHALNRFGAGSFKDLGSIRTGDLKTFNDINAVRGTLINNSHGVYQARLFVENTLSSLDTVAFQLQQMIDFAEEVKAAETPAQRAYSSKYIVYAGDNILRETGYRTDSVGRFGDDLGYTGAATSAVADSDALVSFIKAKDLTDKEQKDVTQGAFEALRPLKAQAGGLTPTDGDLSNAIFTVDAYAAGRFNLEAFGIPGGSFENVDDPDVIDGFIDAVRGALDKVRQVIVGHGENLSELEDAEAYYDDALDQWNEAWYEAGAVAADLREARRNLSPEQKKLSLLEVLSERIERIERENTKAWLKQVKASIGTNERYERLDRGEGTSRLKEAAIQLLDKAERDRIRLDELEADAREARAATRAQRDRQTEAANAHSDADLNSDEGRPVARNDVAVGTEESAPGTATNRADGAETAAARDEAAPHRDRIETAFDIVFGGADDPAPLADRIADLLNFLVPAPAGDKAPD